MSKDSDGFIRFIVQLWSIFTSGDWLWVIWLVIVPSVCVTSGWEAALYGGVLLALILIPVYWAFRASRRRRDLE